MVLDGGPGGIWWEVRLERIQEQYVQSLGGLLRNWQRETPVGFGFQRNVTKYSSFWWLVMVRCRRVNGKMTVVIQVRNNMA